MLDFTIRHLAFQHQEDIMDIILFIPGNQSVVPDVWHFIVPFLAVLLIAVPAASLQRLLIEPKLVVTKLVCDLLLVVVW